MSEKPQPKISIVPYLPDTQSAEDVVALLEELLERAKSGEIVAAAIVGYCRNGAVTTAFTPGVRDFSLMGGLAHLTARISSNIGYGG